LRPAGVSRAIFSIVLVCGASARAIEYAVDAQTVAQAYQVRAPFGGPVLSARRVTQTIGLSVAHAFGARGPRFSLRARLRIDGDFGDACGGAAARCLEETARERRTDFSPGFERRSIDVPFAYVDVSGLWGGAVDARAGRVMTADVLGFSLFDGARVRARFGAALTAEALVGLEVRRGFALSNGRFERDGVLRLDRAGWEPSLAPWVSDAIPAPLVGVAIETPEGLPAFARAVYRRVWTAEGVSEERAGASADAALHPWVRVRGTSAYSIPHRAFSVLGASVTVARPLAAWSVEGAIERVRPTFDPGSIWASLWADGTDEARARASLRAHERLALSVSAWGRRHALSESGPSRGAAWARDLYSAGCAWTAAYDAPAWDLGARAQVEAGSSGERGGLDVDGAIEPWGDRVRLDGRASLWWQRDAIRADRSGLSLSVVGGAATRLGALAWVHLDGEYDRNAIVGDRFRVSATLAVGASP
jgi:hypothetical protein